MHFREQTKLIYKHIKGESQKIKYKGVSMSLLNAIQVSSHLKIMLLRFFNQNKTLFSSPEDLVPFMWVYT